LDNSIEHLIKNSAASSSLSNIKMLPTPFIAIKSKGLTNKDLKKNCYASLINSESCGGGVLPA
jgi:hypothetical protein